MNINTINPDVILHILSFTSLQHKKTLSQIDTNFNALVILSLLREGKLFCIMNLAKNSERILACQLTKDEIKEIHVYAQKTIRISLIKFSQYGKEIKNLTKINESNLRELKRNVKQFGKLNEEARQFQKFIHHHLKIEFNLNELQTKKETLLRKRIDLMNRIDGLESEIFTLSERIQRLMAAKNNEISNRKTLAKLFV